MIVLRDLFSRMQSDATGCLAVVAVSLTDGTVVDSCGDDAIDVGPLASVVRELFSRDHAALQTLATDRGGAQREWIILADERTYVCHRSAERPHLALALVCRNERNLGLAVGLLRKEIAAGEGI